MIDAIQFQQLLANTLFGGDMFIAGICMYMTVLALIFTIFYRSYHIGIIIMIPTTLIFNLMGILSQEATVLMVVIAVLILAMGAKKTFGD